jgi:hypothetical protein
MPYKRKTDAFTLSFEGRKVRSIRRVRLQPDRFVHDRVNAYHVSIGANAEPAPRPSFSGCPTLVVGGWVLGSSSSNVSAVAGVDHLRIARPDHIPPGISPRNPPFLIASPQRLEIDATRTQQVTKLFLIATKTAISARISGIKRRNISPSQASNPPNPAYFKGGTDRRIGTSWGHPVFWPTRDLRSS